MLKRKFRLPRAEFPKRGSSRVTSPLFVLYHSLNHLPYNRYAVLIGKRVEKKAVRRNRIKRIFLSQLSMFPSVGRDFLYVVSPQASRAEKGIIEKELQHACGKILKPES